MKYKGGVEELNTVWQVKYIIVQSISVHFDYKDIQEWKYIKERTFMPSNSKISIRTVS